MQILAGRLLLLATDLVNFSAAYTPPISTCAI